MGLFSDASEKAHQSQFEDEPLTSTGGEFGAMPSSQCDVKIAAELENSLDLVWGRVRANRQFLPGMQGHALAVTHWEPREGATTLALALAFRAAQIDATCSFCLADF